MIGTEPDAWDECATCGHDRDEHDANGCRALQGPTWMSVHGALCNCARFAEDPEAA